MKAPLKQTGRPKIKTGKRDKIIKARLNEEELRQLIAIEKQLGLSRTTLIKERLLRQSDRILVNAAELMVQLDGIGTELGRAGNNINQLARLGHTLNLQGYLTPQLVENFNELLDDYIRKQVKLETVIRELIRLMK